jgi:hypothetical protein
MVAGWRAGEESLRARAFDPPLPFDPAITRPVAEAIVSGAVSHGWTVERQLELHLTRHSTDVDAPPIALERIEDGVCIAGVAHASGMFAAADVYFDEVDTVPVERPSIWAHACRAGDEDFRRGPAQIRTAVSSVRCYHRPTSTVRYQLHVYTESIWSNADAEEQRGSIGLTILRGREADLVARGGLELEDGDVIERGELPRGSRTVSIVRALRAAAVALGAWWGVGSAVLVLAGWAVRHDRRAREALEAPSRRTVGRLTAVVPRSMRPELEAMLRDGEGNDHARLERARNRLLARSSEIAALGLARWRGSSKAAQTMTTRLKQELDAIDTRAAGYRGAEGELVALTIVLRHAGETMGYDLTLDRAGAESALRATVPLAPEELESLAWRWTPRDPGGGLDLDGLDEVMHGLLRVDGGKLVECEACGAVRLRAIDRCGCTTAG